MEKYFFVILDYKIYKIFYFLNVDKVCTKERRRIDIKNSKIASIENVIQTKNGPPEGQAETREAIICRKGSGAAAADGGG